MEFRKKLGALLNAENKENGSDTPDFILARFLDACLQAFDEAANRRTAWYGEAVKKMEDLGELELEEKEEPK